MAGRAHVALWSALLAGALLCAGAFTVDCNHEYTDCDTELSKLVEDDELGLLTVASNRKSAPPPPPFLPTIPPQPPTVKIIPVKESKPSTIAVNTEIQSTTETSKIHVLPRIEPPEIIKRPRLLNINVDENLQNFANALHNQTTAKTQKIDLSDVNMEEEDDEALHIIKHDHSKHGKPISNQFYANLQVPFNPLLAMDHASEEQDTCKENGIVYKIGDRLDRSCDEACECQPGGIFDCTPRCKHPYIRRGRRLNDPLCFESPVDDCCSIIACATGNQDVKSKVEVCRYSNMTYAVGEKWHIKCEQTCSCEANSVVTCRPRCNKLIASEKCINVQDPHDECCEVQVCDVSQDVHEEPENVTSSTSTTTTTTTSTSTTTSTTTARSIIQAIHSFFESQQDTTLIENPITTTPNPIGSVKVLQNNSVQVNLIQMNSSDNPIYLQLSSDGGNHFDDVELKQSNLILNLPGGKDYILKSRESGNKFNFTITASIDTENDTVRIEETEDGCYHDGMFYAVGEEFHIGCSELCECTGSNTSECVELVCPSHVGLELVSKGCVRWAPSPPAVPPNCCPRSARCLSDGTCHYNGIEVPNWTEVPISLTGCEQRCFCENGELDCQEVCSPLPPVPPQTLRCPLLHHPAPMNISDEDCCKHWGCVPNAHVIETTTSTTTTLPSTMKIEPTTTVSSTVAYPQTTVPQTTTTEEITAIMDLNDRHHVHPVKYTSFIMPKTLPVIKDSVQMHFNTEEGGYQTKGKTESLPQPTVLDCTQTPLKLIPSEPNIESDPFLNKLLMNLNKYKDIQLDFNNDKKITYHKVNPTVKPNSEDKAQKFILPSFGRRNYFVPAQSESREDIYFYKPTVAKVFSNMFIPLGLKNKSNEYNIINDKKINKHTITLMKNILQNGHFYDKFNDKKLKDYLKEKYIPIDSTTYPPFKILEPYENVLMKPVRLTNYKVPRIQSPLELDQLVSQMEIESEVNRNLGRSADNTEIKRIGTVKQPPAPELSTSVNGQTPFLPTVVPPMIHFPTEDIPDYDQNNVHHPINSRDQTIPGTAPGFNPLSSYGEENKKLSVLSIQADSPTSIKLLFGLPPVLVGLRGSVDLRYTDQADDDISHWSSQVFAPADEILTTPRLEFRLTGLKPSTIYRIKGKLFLHNLPVEPESQVYSVRTLDLPVMPPIEEKKRQLDSRLALVDVNDTAAHISWRHFTEDELQFIDGIQVRYRPVGTPIYSMTELLHHSRTIAELHDLRPGTKYEASLVLIPPPRTTTELHDPKMVDFSTAPFIDLYNWTVTIEARAVGSDAAELTWHGVPSPAERWVRVYRAAHACGATRHEHDAFRLAARDLPPTIKLSGLEANSRCRVWMELFLTNGKIKTSNVLEINTRSEDSPEEIDNEIDTAGVAGEAGARGGGRGDYYGALVVVGVVAALGALTSLLLLLVLVRRHRPRSVPITPVPSAPRESSLPPYDNPAYKLELQQETMDSFVGLWARYYNKIPDEVLEYSENKFNRFVKDALCKKAYYKLDEYLNDKTIWCIDSAQYKM